MSTEEPYLDMMKELRLRDNYVEVMEGCLKPLSGLLNGSDQITSCVGLGVGTGHFEVELIRRHLPTIKRFVAVEPDDESLKELRERVAKTIPNVRCEIVDSTIQEYKGVNDPVNLVLIFQCLYYVNDADRKQLFANIRRNWLASAGGWVVIAHTSRTTTPGTWAELYSRLGKPLVPWETVEADMKAVGFNLENELEFSWRRDLRDLDDNMIRFFRHQVDESVTPEQVRKVIEELFPKGYCDQLWSKFGVFKAVENNNLHKK